MPSPKMRAEYGCETNFESGSAPFLEMQFLLSPYDPVDRQCYQDLFFSGRWKLSKVLLIGKYAITAM
jgi:hypothetical protein